MNYTPARIFLAEDNEDEVLIVRRALAQSRVATELHVSKDGQEAIDHLFGDGARPDLILLDVSLPVVSGMDVLAKLQADPELALIPVVMLTASARTEDISRSYELGSNTYVQKPVEFETFSETIQMLVEYWISVAKLPATN